MGKKIGGIVLVGAGIYFLVAGGFTTIVESFKDGAIWTGLKPIITSGALLIFGVNILINGGKSKKSKEE